MSFVPTPLLPALFFLSGATIFLAWVIRRARRKSDATQVFPSYRVDDPLLRRINETLLTLSEESGNKAFTAQRAVSMSVDDHVFTLLEGSVGAPGVDDGWIGEELVFVLAPRADEDWFGQRADLFAPIFRGSSFCLYRADARRIQNAMDHGIDSPGVRG